MKAKKSVHALNMNSSNSLHTTMFKLFFFTWCCLSAAAASSKSLLPTEKDNIEKLPPFIMELNNENENDFTKLGPTTTTTDLFDDENNTSKRSVGVVVEDPIVIPIGPTQDTDGGNTYRARRFVIRNMDFNKANFLLYPYEFNYTSTINATTDATETFTDGAFVSTLPAEEFPDKNTSGWFRWLNDQTTMDLSKAKAVYDSNIAILRVASPKDEDGNTMEITYESDTFCTMFYSWISGKYAKCFISPEDYDAYIARNPTHVQQPFLMHVTPGNISAGVLSSQSSAGAENRFGILIIPDTIGKQHDYVKSLLEPVRDQITTFVSRGGVLVTSGKGAIQLETLGLVPDSTFSTRYTMRSTTGTNVGIEGCDGMEQAPLDDTEDEFTHRTLCFSPPRYSYEIEGKNVLRSALISAPLINDNVTAHGMKAISWFDTSLSSFPLRKHDEETGLDTELPLANKARSYPMTMYKSHGRGFVVTFLSNPSFEFTTTQWIYDTFFLAGSRPLALDNEIIGGFERTIPALENVKLKVELKLTNYFTMDITEETTLTVWVRNGTIAESLTPLCNLVNETTAPPSESLRHDMRFVCALPTIDKLSSQTFRFSVEIVDPLVTQAGENVVILWPRMEYTDPRGNAERMQEYGVTIGAAMAALLRAEMNIDPSSTYPLHASGSYIDNVMNCENKEGTTALNVVHYSIVPIVSPFIDISDQIRMVGGVEFDTDYYKKATNNIADYNYPFNDGDADYLDWDLLHNRSNILAASWDEGVKISKEERASFGELASALGIDPVTVMNANFQSTNDDDLFILKQEEFQDSDKFYEHATQRLMAFLDPSDPSAAETLWPSGTIPVEERSESWPDRAKKRIYMARHDLFFLRKYTLPDGFVNHTTLVSIDRYANPTCGSENNYTVAGGFGNDVPGGLIPREWPNVMLLDCTRRPLLDMDTIETATGSKAASIHYIVPIDPADAKVAGDVMDFDPTTGEYKNYPEVKIKQVFMAQFDILPSLSRRGGELQFTFPSGNPWGTVEGMKTAIEKGFVQFSADQIAVYKTYVGETNKLCVRFKRGNMPNEAFGQPSHLKMFLEETTTITVSATMDLYEMKYDMSSPETNYEDWTKCTASSVEISFSTTAAFVLPAVKLSIMPGETLENSIMQPYELREPLVRYGLYEQELLQHRPIHGSAEIHPIIEPCLVTKNGGFSTFTHVGTSSVPFREYVTTGASLQIPAAPETGRVEWKDIWGRQWVQNVRSTIFEYPPIPPPLRNFEMTTTFEILNSAGERMLDWQSDEKVDVHVQMKMVNNYPKWFEITNCKANEVMQLCGIPGKQCGISRLFQTDGEYVQTPESDSLYQWFTQGHNASYGICFRDPEVFLEGTQLTEIQRNAIQSITTCAKDLLNITGCDGAIEGLPILRKRPDTDNSSLWNWAQQVLDYWPANYIKDIMWDMTHYDYDDTVFDKAYKYHMDNNLPHLGHVITKPQNHIAFPLYKGFGYSMSYDKTHTQRKFPGKMGWWSDNLQNRDHTLVAGQSTSNDVSVGKSSLIPDSKWIDITNLEDTANSSFASDALKNVYTCRFNRHIHSLDPAESDKAFHMKNVYMNNVVPVPPDFEKSWETNYDCSDGVHYGPLNISQFPNMVYTNTARDWLYFASNLRGNAKENINVIYQLEPLTDQQVKFEGLAKVQDGGRFTYWNPANGPNSYLVVDNPVSLVLAKRNDHELNQELIPTYTTTFDSLVFQHFTLSDPKEIEREWTLPVYLKHNGFGDFTVSTYVGDKSTTCFMTPGGERARVKFTFMNNAGFDINMLKNAINSTEVSQEAINANDLMKNVVHTLRCPTAYNFITFEVPEDLKEYVSIKPSTDVVGVASLFFDFESINVVQIRDGFKGDYYVDLKILDGFPDSMRGRLYEIPVTLQSQYFDKLPGPNDPTGIHDYTVTVPSIVFGVPYQSGSPYAGKIFYTSGYATQLHLMATLDSPWTVEGAKFVTETEVDEFRLCLGHNSNPTLNETEGEIFCMEKLWNALELNQGCTFSSIVDTEGRKTVDFDMTQYAPTFPIKEDPVNGADVAKLQLLVRTTAKQLPSGYPLLSHYYKDTFVNCAEKTQKVNMWSRAYVHSKGAYLSLSWSQTLVSSTGLPLLKQDLSPEDSGFADITVTITNTGDSYAYNTNFSLKLSSDVTPALPGSMYSTHLALPDGCTLSGDDDIQCVIASVLPPQSPYTFVFRVFFGPDTRSGAMPDATDSDLAMHPISDAAFGYIDLTEFAGERTVEQSLLGPYGFLYSALTSPQVLLSGERSGDNAVLNVTHDFPNIKSYVWSARLKGTDDSFSIFTITKTQQITASVKSLWEDLIESNKYPKETEMALEFVVSISELDLDNAADVSELLADSNIWTWEKSSSEWWPLLFLLTIPLVVLPLSVAAVMFYRRRAKRSGVNSNRSSVYGDQNPENGNSVKMKQQHEDDVHWEKIRHEQYNPDGKVIRKQKL